MPSDELRVRTLEALQPARDAFRDALATAVEEVRSFLASRETTSDKKVAREEHSLGTFAAGRVNPERFTSLLAQTLTIDDVAGERIERAFSTLQALAQDQEALGFVSVEPGASLRDTVAAKLAQVGRAFGAAHVVRAARAGTYEEEEHGAQLDGFPFARWGPAEREIAPPLCVEVSGTDLQAGGLTEFLDGRLKLVLLVDGDCSPAPLARLITPNTFVVQTADPKVLAAFVRHRGPGVAAIVPEGAAQFAHDPRAGDEPADRISIEHTPEEAPRKPCGAISVTQQAEDLAALHALAGARSGLDVQNDGADPTNKLAAWLLSQTDLKDLT